MRIINYILAFLLLIKFKNVCCINDTSVMQQSLIQVCEVSYYQGDLDKIKSVNFFYLDEVCSKNRHTYFDVLDQNSIASYSSEMKSLYDAAFTSSRYIRGNSKNELQIVISLKLPEDGFLYDIREKNPSEQSKLISAYLSQRDYYNMESYATQKAWVSVMRAIDRITFGYEDNKRVYLGWDEVHNYTKNSKEKIEAAGYKVNERFYVVKTFFG